MSRRKHRGTIKERSDGRFEARVTVGYKPNGRAIHRSAYRHTREEADKALTELLHKHDKGMLADPDRMTVADAVERYITGKVNEDESTRYKARTEARPILDIIGRKRLQDLRPNHVRDAYVMMAREGLSVRAQRRAAMHLKAALREAVSDGIVYRNVAEGVKMSAPRVDDTEGAQAWTVDEVDRFLQAARGELKKKPTGGRQAKDKGPEWVPVPPDEVKPVPLYPLYYLMLSLGLRRGEALGLPWKAIDLEGGTLRVMQSLSPVGRGDSYAIKPVKTAHSRRVLYLPQDVRMLLEGHRAGQDELREFMGSGWKGNGLVITTASGTPVLPRNALRSFKELQKGLGVTPIRLHDLRHTHATLALHRGVPVEVVSERLGHARVDITLNLYRHLYQAERQAAALSLTDLLGNRQRTVN